MTPHRFQIPDTSTIFQERTPEEVAESVRSLLSALSVGESWGKDLPQELRDAICLHARSSKVCVALLASKYVRDVISGEKRSFFVGKLKRFMQGGLAEALGISYLGDEQVPSKGAWSMDEGSCVDFINNTAQKIIVVREHAEDHFDSHFQDLGVFGGDIEEREADAWEATEDCVKTHMACILALGGYLTDRDLNVTGRRSTYSEISDDILAAVDLCSVAHRRH